MICKTFFLFPGQGAQYPGMALDFLEQENSSLRIRRLFSLAREIFGRDPVALLRDLSPEELKRTDVSQPAITLANLAAAAFLGEKGIMPAGCAGFSLGEYSALAAAGVISEEDCLFLVEKRGKAMQAAIDRLPPWQEAPGMAAVIGLAPALVEELIAKWEKSGIDAPSAANINSPRQVVVSGSAAALNEAEKRFLEAGAKRFMRLEVAGPYHSPFMKQAAEEFNSFLDMVKYSDPLIPVFSNVSGKRITSGSEAKALSRRHILEGVRWTDEENSIALLEPEMLLETGPGRVLQGLWRQTKNDIPCYSAGTAAEINELEICDKEEVA